jgi:hypothetical protein
MSSSPSPSVSTAFSECPYLSYLWEYKLSVSKSHATWPTKKNDKPWCYRARLCHVRVLREEISREFCNLLPKCCGECKWRVRGAEKDQRHIFGASLVRYYLRPPNAKRPQL